MSLVFHTSFGARFILFVVVHLRLYLSRLHMTVLRRCVVVKVVTPATTAAAAAAAPNSVCFE